MERTMKWVYASALVQNKRRRRWELGYKKTRWYPENLNNSFPHQTQRSPSLWIFIQTGQILSPLPHLTCTLLVLETPEFPLWIMCFSVTHTHITHCTRGICKYTCASLGRLTKHCETYFKYGCWWAVNTQQNTLLCTKTQKTSEKHGQSFIWTLRHLHR